VAASFQRFFRSGDKRLEKEESSRGKEALTLIPKSASESKNKQIIMSHWLVGGVWSGCCIA